MKKKEKKKKEVYWKHTVIKILTFAVNSLSQLLSSGCTVLEGLQPRGRHFEFAPDVQLFPRMI
jgi:hypothetical protein